METDFEDDEIDLTRWLWRNKKAKKKNKLKILTN